MCAWCDGGPAVPHYTGVVGHNHVLAGFFTEISAAKLRVVSSSPVPGPFMVSSSPIPGPFVLLETQEW